MPQPKSFYAHCQALCYDGSRWRAGCHSDPYGEESPRSEESAPPGASSVQPRGSSHGACPEGLPRRAQRPRNFGVGGACPTCHPDPAPLVTCRPCLPPCLSFPAYPPRSSSPSAPAGQAFRPDIEDSLNQRAGVQPPWLRVGVNPEPRNFGTARSSPAPLVIPSLPAPSGVEGSRDLLFPACPACAERSRSKPAEE